MAVETGVTPSLELTAPKVVITEHESTNPSSSTIPAECISDVDRKPLDKTSEAATAVATPVVPNPVADELHKDSNVDNPEHEGGQSAACGSELATDQLTKESNVKHSTGQESGPSVELIPKRVAESINVVDPVVTPNPVQDNFRCFSGFCSTLRRFGYRYLKMTKHRFWRYLGILMLALPISAAVMGSRFLEDCKMSPATPYLLFSVGIMAFVILAFRVVIFRIEFKRGKYCMKIVVGTLFIFALIIFCIEMLAFWSFNPSFDETSPQYCHPAFYYYTYSVNCTTACFMAILIPTLVAKWLVSGPNAD